MPVDPGQQSLPEVVHVDARDADELAGVVVELPGADEAVGGRRQLGARTAVVALHRPPTLGVELGDHPHVARPVQTLSVRLTQHLTDLVDVRRQHDDPRIMAL